MKTYRSQKTTFLLAYFFKRKVARAKRYTPFINLMSITLESVDKKKKKKSVYYYPYAYNVSFEVSNIWTRFRLFRSVDSCWKYEGGVSNFVPYTSYIMIDNNLCKRKTSRYSKHRGLNDAIRDVSSLCFYLCFNTRFFARPVWCNSVILFVSVFCS